MASQTVFSTADLLLYWRGATKKQIVERINDYVARGYLQRLRRGLYAKTGYESKEVACKVYTPAYISFDTVLREGGVIFQWGDAVTCASYLSRTVTIDGQEYVYKKYNPHYLQTQEGFLLPIITLLQV